MLSLKGKATSLIPITWFPSSNTFSFILSTKLATSLSTGISSDSVDTSRELNLPSVESVSNPIFEKLVPAEANNTGSPFLLTTKESDITRCS